MGGGRRGSRPCRDRGGRDLGAGTAPAWLDLQLEVGGAVSKLVRRGRRRAVASLLGFLDPAAGRDVLGVVGKEGVGEAEHRLDARVGDPVVDRSPSRRPSPRRREQRPFEWWAELDAVAANLSPRYRAMVVFAAATGLWPAEWIALERRDMDLDWTVVDGWCGRRSLRLAPASTTQTRAKQAKTRSPPADSNRRPLLAIAPSPAPVMCPVGADREAAARQRSSASRCATVSACGRRASAASRMSERTEAARALRSTSGSTAPTWASLHRASVSAERSS